MDNKVTCRLCGTDVPKMGLHRHLSFVHKTNTAEYNVKFGLAKPSLYDPGKVEGQDYVICKICGKRFDILSRHLQLAHELSQDVYLDRFPGAATSSEKRLCLARDSVGKLSQNLTTDQRARMRDIGIRNLVDYNKSDAHRLANRTVVAASNRSSREIAKELVSGGGDFSI